METKYETVQSFFSTNSVRRRKEKRNTETKADKHRAKEFCYGAHESIIQNFLKAFEGHNEKMFPINCECNAEIQGFMQ